MAQLHRGFREFTKRSTAVVVIGPEDAKAFADYWRERDLPFIGLPAPGRAVPKRHGQEVKLHKMGHLPAHASPPAARSSTCAD